MSQREQQRISDFPWRDPGAPRVEVSQAIRQHCTRDLCRKSRPSTSGRVLLSLLVSASVIGLLAFLTRDHPRSPGALRIAAFGTLGWMAVQTWILFVGLAAPPGRRIARAARLSIVLAVPLAFLVYLNFAARESLSAIQFASASAHTERAVSCGSFTLAVGALAGACVIWVWRRTDPLSPGLSGALAGLFGGLTGAVAAGCACPTQEVWHLWLAHGLTVIALVGLGGLAGRRWLSP